MTHQPRWYCGMLEWASFVGKCLWFASPSRWRRLFSMTEMRFRMGSDYDSLQRFKLFLSLVVAAIKGLVTYAGTALLDSSNCRLQCWFQGSLWFLNEIYIDCNSSFKPCSKRLKTLHCYESCFVKSTHHMWSRFRQSWSDKKNGDIKIILEAKSSWKRKGSITKI